MGQGSNTGSLGTSGIAGRKERGGLSRNLRGGEKEWLGLGRSCTELAKPAARARVFLALEQQNIDGSWFEG